MYKVNFHHRITDNYKELEYYNKVYIPAISSLPNSVRKSVTASRTSIIPWAGITTMDLSATDLESAIVTLNRRTANVTIRG